MKEKLYLKRVLKLIVSLVFLSGHILFRAARYMAGIKEPSYIVIYYHNVKNSEKEKFARQIKLSQRLTTIISSDEINQVISARNYLIITFDDIYQSILQNAVPFLIDKNIPFTLFVPSAYLGKSPDWENIPGEIRQSEKIISSDQLRQLDNGLVTVGSHSETHPVFTNLTRERIDQELKKSKCDLELICGKRIRMFSFPYGIYNDQSLNMAIEAGYDKVFTIDPDILYDYKNQKTIGRTSVSPDDWKLEFVLKILGAYAWHGAYSRYFRRT